VDTGLVLENWWSAFDDPVLHELVKRANGRNLLLKEAIARIEESSALLQAATGKMLPQIDATGTVSHDNGQQSENASGLSMPGAFSTKTTYSIGMSSSWEVDLFGRIRRSTEAASARYEASVEDFRGVLVLLYAEIATAYIDYRTFHHRLTLAEEQLEYEKRLRNIAATRFKAGTASQVEMAEAEAGLATAGAQVPILKNARTLSVNRLSALMALPPGSLSEMLQPVRPIPEPPGAIVVSFPVDVVRQRPDIRNAERLLAAQTAMIGVRAADLYPRFSLLGSFSFTSLSAETLLESASFGFNFGPTLTWNIFQGGDYQGSSQSRRGANKTTAGRLREHLDYSLRGG
jgi:NodT family efflux transporter outer membrane factor (OMF) lipoprotein